MNWLLSLAESAQAEQANRELLSLTTDRELVKGRGKTIAETSAGAAEFQLQRASKQQLRLSSQELRASFSPWPNCVNLDSQEP
ncbi:hypothetical protein ACRRTK_011096 [Alexandromys fortis]